jgi:chromosome transmission fidelity protein 18
MSDYSTGIPSSFDPALLYSDFDHLQPNAPPSTSFSDDFDALQQCITEEKAKKTHEGVVIQHRAWKLTEAFRSEGDALLGIASSTSCRILY